MGNLDTVQNAVTESNGKTATKCMENADAVPNTTVYSRQVRAGRRVYYFDVKAMKSMNDFYIVITESRRKKEEKKFEKHKLFLYKEDFRNFFDALSEAITHVERNLLKPPEALSVARIAEKRTDEEQVGKQAVI